MNSARRDTEARYVSCGQKHLVKLKFAYMSVKIKKKKLSVIFAISNSNCFGNLSVILHFGLFFHCYYNILIIFNDDLMQIILLQFM